MSLIYNKVKLIKSSFGNIIMLLRYNIICISYCNIYTLNLCHLKILSLISQNFKFWCDFFRYLFLLMMMTMIIKTPK